MGSNFEISIGDTVRHIAEAMGVEGGSRVRPGAAAAGQKRSRTPVGGQRQGSAPDRLAASLRRQGRLAAGDLRKRFAGLRTQTTCAPTRSIATISDAMNNTFEAVVRCVRQVHGLPQGAIPLHAPVFSGNEDGLRPGSRRFHLCFVRRRLCEPIRSHAPGADRRGLCRGHGQRHGRPARRPASGRRRPWRLGRDPGCLLCGHGQRDRLLRRDAGFCGR